VLPGSIHSLFESFLVPLRKRKTWVQRSLVGVACEDLDSMADEE
jgi:hypothetical protein